MWDLGVPYCAATIAYEDNDACGMMTQAQKPTPWACHIDITYHLICQWVEDDLIKLEWISPKMNIADIFTKQLGPLLFRRHCDYLTGRVPPQYSAHYQDLHLMTNPERLWGRENEGGHEAKWIGDSSTYAAAAAKLWVDNWGDSDHHETWHLATQFWRRNCVEVDC